MAHSLVDCRPPRSLNYCYVKETLSIKRPKSPKIHITRSLVALNMVITRLLPYGDKRLFRMTFQV